MAWIIPKAKKSKAPRTEETEAKRVKKVPKAESYREGNRKTNPVIPTEDTRLEDGGDLGDDEAEIPLAKPRPKERQSYQGSSDREEDGVSQGYSHVSRSHQKETARGSGQTSQVREKEDRKEEGKRTLQEGQEGGPTGYGPSRPQKAENTAISVLSAEEKRVNPVTPSNSEGFSSTVSMAMEQRRPLPILRNLGIDEKAEKLKVDSLPKYACSTCQIGPECPEFKEGYVCAFNDQFKAFPARDADAVLSLMVEVVDSNKVRWRMAKVNEVISSGGMADPNVTRLSEVVMNQARSLVELQQEVNKVTVSVTGPTDEAPNRAGGIFAKLFGSTNTVVEAPVLEMNPVTMIDDVPTRADDHRGEAVEVSADGVEELPAERAPMGSNEVVPGSKGLAAQRNTVGMTSVISLETTQRNTRK